MTDRLTPGQLRDLADVVQSFDTLLAANLRREAARREAEGFVPEAARQAVAVAAGLTSAPPMSDAPPPPAPDDLVRGLRDRARHARAEGNATATSDAWHFEQAADAIEALRAELAVSKARDALHDTAIEATVSVQRKYLARAEAAEADAKRLREALEAMLTSTEEDFDGDWELIVQEARAALAQGGNDDK